MKSLTRLVSVAVTTAILLVVQGAALAGTTGGINGTVVDDSGAPVAGASVSAVSPSGSAATTTDGTGHFVFLSLEPDTYTLTVSKPGVIATVSETGVLVLADQNTRVPVKAPKFTKTLGTVTVRTTSGLVRPGSTTIVYTIDATTNDIAHAMGGNAYNQNNIYGILQLVPGTSQHRGLTNNSFTIRGGQSDQVGFEYDGIPVNRAFDNGNALTGSTVGMQQLQVYTGGGPPNLQGAQTSTGFVNQVIKSGTFPGFTELTVGVADPTMYNSVLYEHGGATTNGRFTYYFAYGASNVKQRFYTQFDGVGLHPWVYGFNPYAETTPSWGAIAPPCVVDSNGKGGQDPVLAGQIPLPLGGDAGCAFWAYAPALFTPDIQENRDGVLNLHFGLPHRRGGLKDDLQFLTSNGYQVANNRDSVFDAGGLAQVEAFNHNFSITPYWTDTIAFGSGVQWGQGINPNAPFPQLPVVAYKTPGSPAVRCANVLLGVPGACASANFSLIPANARSGNTSQYGITKLQFTRALTDTSYLRVYGYTLYSGLFTNGAPVQGSGGLCCFSEGDEPADFELSTHTRGLSAQYANQLSSKHLLYAFANYSTQSGVNWDNKQASQGSQDLTGDATSVTNLVSYDANGNPTCYIYGAFIDPRVAGQIGQPTFCDDSHGRGTFSNPAETLQFIPSSTPGSPLNGCSPCWGPFDPANQAAYANSPAGQAGASWIVSSLGLAGTLNTVRPAWSSFAVEDQYHPSDKVQIDASLRLDRQTYFLPNTNSADYNFWFAAARQEVWYDPTTGQPWTSGRRSPNNGNINFGTGPGGIYLGLQCPTSDVPGTYVCSGPGAPVHPDGLNGHLFYTNAAPSSITNQTFEPGIGMTYTFNPDTVGRLHVGVGSDPVGSNGIFYANASAGGTNNGAALGNYATWFGLGYPSIAHNLKPRTATNVDLSYERRFKGTDLSMTITPFYRNTQNEYINTSATYPGATFLTRGIEFQMAKGHPDQNGYAAYLAFTYTHQVMHLLDSPLNGTNPIDSWNYYIDAYNALTAQGDRHGSKGAMCYAANNSNNPDPTGAAPPGDCSIVSGQIVMTATGVANGDVVNPYYFFPAQPGYDRNGWYYANTYVPTGQSGFGAGARLDSFIPYQFAGYVSYRHNKLQVAPTFSVWGGTHYGSPLDIMGIDPRSCTANQQGYSQYNPGTYGGANGPNGFPWQNVPTAPFQGALNWLSCGGNGYINGYYPIVPLPDTHQYPGWAAYTNPWHLNIGTVINYNLTSTTTAQLNISNIANYCWGGSKQPWTAAYPANSYTCSYQYNPTNYAPGYWNGSGPNDSLANGPPMSTYFAQIYAPVVDTWPFNATLTVKFKL